MFNAVYNFAKEGGEGILPPLFQKFGGKLLILGESPSLALDATLVQYLTGRTPIERLHWKYVYLKATDN